MNRTGLASRTFLALALAAAMFAGPAQAEQTQVWRLELDRPVKWFKSSTAGVVLVGTDREIVGVASDSGSVLWRIGPIKDSHRDDVELLGDRPEALLTVGIQGSPGVPPVSLIDLRDGHTLWTRQPEGMIESIGSFVVPGTDHLLVRATTAEDGSRKTGMLVDLHSGVPIWTNESIGAEFESVLPFWYGQFRIESRQAPLMLGDSSMIFHMRDAMFRRFDLKTGKLVWTANGTHAEPYTAATDAKHRASLQGAQIAHGTTYNDKTKKVEVDPDKDSEQFEERDLAFEIAPMLRSTNGTRFYAPYQRSVAAFSLTTGLLLWNDPPKLHGPVVQMLETPAGLLVRTAQPEKDDIHHRVMLLDLETGAVLWRWPGKTGLLSLKNDHWQDASNFLLENDRLVIAAEGKLRATGLGQPKEQTLAQLKFVLDEAITLVSVPDGYVVVGRSNLGIYAKADGRRTKEYHCDPPDHAGWGLSLLALSAATKGWVDPKLGWEVLNIDLSESHERESYVYFLAEARPGRSEGPALVRVRRETGDVTGEMRFGKGLPDYSLDSEGRIFFLTDKNAMLCYRF